MSARLAVLLSILITSPALAVGINTPMGEVLCTIADWATGNTGKGLATLAVTIIGIGSLLGKVSWGTALTVGVGIAVLFGAAGIAGALGATGSCATLLETFV